MKETFTAWAIQSISEKYLLGRYFFHHILPDSLEGCQTSLFKTRALARKYSKRTYYKSRVVKVIVKIDIVK